jgi:Protein of unknown function (DUF1257)
MSHFAQIQTAITDRESLLKTLAALGLESVSEYATAKPLNNYYQTKDAETAHIIVAIPKLQAELGFRLEGNSYIVIGDDWELDRYLGQNFIKSKLMGEYAHQVVVKQAEALRPKLGNYQITREVNNGEHRVRVQFDRVQVVARR